MGKYILEKSKISERFDAAPDVGTIKEFCDWLSDSPDDCNKRNDLTSMLKKEVISREEAPDDYKRITRISKFEELLQWVRDNCIMEGERVNTEEKEKNKGSEDTEAKASEINFSSKGAFEKNSTDVIKEFENNGYKNLTILDEEDLDYSVGDSDDIVFYEQGIITLNSSKIELKVEKDGLELDPGRILLIKNEGSKVLALGVLVPKDKKTYAAVFDDKKYIRYDEFRDISQARFVVYDKEGNAYSRQIDIEYREFTKTDRPLCIDFGTSNTTAGSYGINDPESNEAEIVKFIDVTTVPNNSNAFLLPTMVYVDDCSDKNNIKYLFGYEARKKIEEDHYESSASVFYEIKRWISSPDVVVEIRDNANHRAQPKRIDIIKAYIDYVIECAEQYFKTRFKYLHFSAPVKLKSMFLDRFSELYEGQKTVLSAGESIDEAIAIVYNKIIALTDAENGIKPNIEKSIMIMDCGGGTTDLASCFFTYENKTDGKKLRLKTCFENGNPNFGGNNITYRIMQLLKIKTAAAIKGEGNVEAKELINKTENEILSLVDTARKKKEYDSDNANRDVYAEFLKRYEEAEKIIPTIYEKNEVYRGKEQKKKIKRNFFYLWRQAEQIKIDFYRTEKVEMKFNDPTDIGIDIVSNGNYYLYVSDGSDKLIKEKEPFKNVRVNYKEINRVICGDIYALLVGLFQNDSKENESDEIHVDQFHYYKLSGQSCKISLFSELLKEYIPGKKLRPTMIATKAEKNINNVETLKLDCVLGSINYIKDQRSPEITIETTTQSPEIIYDVIRKGIHDEDEILFDHSSRDGIPCSVCAEDTREYQLSVIGKDKEEERSFTFKLYKKNDEKDDQWKKDDLQKQLEEKSSVERENIIKFIDDVEDTSLKTKDNINVVFVVPAKEGYGFYVSQLFAEYSDDKSTYSLIRFEYENFEDTSKTFFDGRR